MVMFFLQVELDPVVKTHDLMAILGFAHKHMLESTGVLSIMNKNSTSKHQLPYTIVYPGRKPLYVSWFWLYNMIQLPIILKYVYFTSLYLFSVTSLHHILEANTDSNLHPVILGMKNDVSYNSVAKNKIIIIKNYNFWEKVWTHSFHIILKKTEWEKARNK